MLVHNITLRDLVISFFLERRETWVGRPLERWEYPEQCDFYYEYNTWKHQHYLILFLSSILHIGWIIKQKTKKKNHSKVFYSPVYMSLLTRVGIQVKLIRVRVDTPNPDSNLD